MSKMGQRGEHPGRTKTVLLSRGLRAVVDEGDYYLVGLHRWQAFSSSGSFHARRQYRVPGGKKATVTMSHVILGVGPDQAVRHLNGDTLDCTRANLLAVPRRGMAAVDPETGIRPQKPATDPLDEPAPRTLGPQRAARD